MFKLLRTNQFLLLMIIALAAVLRFWDLDKVPVSLFGDELDMGYHAYSFLKTGKDYTGHLFPLHLQSLADKKAPMYAYLTVPTVALFGISPLGVRLPAAFMGILNIVLFFLVIRHITKNSSLALISALVLAITPWHIHYSRWGFEGTLMIALYLGGLYCFFRSFGNNKWLVFSSILLGLTFWSYHAAKVFVPVSIVALVILWGQQWKKFTKLSILISSIVLVLITAPAVYDNFFAGGSERFGSTSLFQDQTAVPQIGFDRLRDAQVRDPKAEIGVKASLPDRLWHNQVTFYAAKLADNYFQALSTDFLFTRGDPNLRHNINNFGQLYKIQIFLIIMGLVFLFAQKITDNKWRVFILLWLFIAPLPGVITVDGGNHASRLLFLLPPLTFLTALGIYCLWQVIGKRLQKTYLIILIISFTLSLFFYLHNYFIHYPWDSEKWWQAGFEEAVKTTVEESKNYKQVYISNADEPALIFFLAWSGYSPFKFQQSYPLSKVDIPKLGTFSKLDNYYFGELGVGSDLYSLGSKLPERSLYLATAKEINLNLITEPDRVPSDLKLIKSISYPSGLPAFYLFSRPN